METKEKNELNRLLIEADRSGKVEDVQNLLDRGADIHYQDKSGKTALFFAASYNTAEVIELLLNNGADIHHQDKSGKTALFFAASYNTAEVVELLLNNGVDIHHQDKYGNTAMMAAAFSCRTEVVELLLNNGADIHHQDNLGKTALFLSSIKGNVETAALLLNNGADIHHQDKIGYTALMDAMKAPAYSYKKIVELLLGRGADIHHQNKIGKTALILSANRGNAEVVKLLLERGADIHHQDKSGETALTSAYVSGHSDLVKLLEDYIKNPEDISDDQAEFSFDKILDQISAIQKAKDDVIKKGNDLDWSRQHDSRVIQKMHIKELVKARFKAQEVCGPAEKCDKKIEENIVILKEILNPHKYAVESLCKNSEYSYFTAQSKFCDHVSELECSGDAKVADICDLYLG